MEIPKDFVIVRIADSDRTPWQLLSDCVADGERFREAQDEALQAVLPAHRAIDVCDPGLVRDAKWPPHKKQRPECAERNVVLQKDVAPLDLAQQFHGPRPANDRKRELAAAFGLRD